MVRTLARSLVGVVLVEPAGVADGGVIALIRITVVMR
jgi:hypothetical protein